MGTGTTGGGVSAGLAAGEVENMDINAVLSLAVAGEEDSYVCDFFFFLFFIVSR